ncbi:hypothetical protein Rsub_02836 [Raphidocelis subcapitata]|uniref:J domain-containing protein n=1 Tax=Raphidocelis subcapitata TaxID=307507 RepID=A0A2V0NPW7_9CHLO|nr:hypothetical protein Rsub_02836 [Raphidocelis subcapitata]|eukprot:GBF89666.1 hypothetical protein Rsub_02836 [Raphidocelis subcapitata]
MGRIVDYYEVLGVPRNSDDVEIKKAYRRLALRHHPDVDPGEDSAREFALVAEAYDVLSNPRHKGVYDLYGEQQLKAGGEGEEPYAFDWEAGPAAVFARFFGTANPYEALEVLSKRFEQLTAAKEPPKPQPTTVDLPVTLEELHSGASKSVSRARRAFGDAGEPMAETRRLEVKVEPGMADGTVFVFEGEGDAAAPGAPQGPLELVLRAAPHPRFRRAGCDLVHTVRLPLYNALAGGSVAVETLDGRTLDVPLDAIVTPGSVLRVPGEGLPKPGAAGGGGGGKRGDLLLATELLFPSHLSLQQKLLLRGALFLPPKLDEAQAKALRAFESAFRDSRHGWSTGVAPQGREGG